MLINQSTRLLYKIQDPSPCPILAMPILRFLPRRRHRTQGLKLSRLFSTHRNRNDFGTRFSEDRGSDLAARCRLQRSLVAELPSTGCNLIGSQAALGSADPTVDREATSRSKFPQLLPTVATGSRICRTSVSGHND